MKKQRKISAVLFGATLFILPLLANLSKGVAGAYAIAGIWTGDEVLQTGAVVIETGAAAAFALGAICPPQFVAFAVVGG